MYKKEDYVANTSQTKLIQKLFAFCTQAEGGLKFSLALCLYFCLTNNSKSLREMCNFFSLKKDENIYR